MWTEMSILWIFPTSLLTACQCFTWIKNIGISSIFNFFSNQKKEERNPDSWANMADPRSAPPLTPTSTVDEKAHEIGEREVCWRMRGLRSPISYPIFVESRRLRHGLVHSAGAWDSPSTHAATSTGRHWRFEGTQRVSLLIFSFSVWHGMSWTEPAAAGLFCTERVGLWLHGVVKQTPASTQRQRLHCASCLKADNQLEIYMSVLLHCL